MRIYRNTFSIVDYICLFKIKAIRIWNTTCSDEKMRAIDFFNLPVSVNPNSGIKNRNQKELTAAGTVPELHRIPY